MGKRLSISHITSTNQIATMFSRLGKSEEAILYLRECLAIADNLVTRS